MEAALERVPVHSGRDRQRRRQSLRRQLPHGLVRRPRPRTKTSREQDGLEQTVQVFDTAGGRSVLSVQVAPPVLDGVNYTLSPDGGQLAVLQATTLNIYFLREMSADERTKYLAIKDDAPGLYVPPPRANGDSAPETIEISAADDSGAPDPAIPASTPIAATSLAKAPATSTGSPGTLSASAASATRATDGRRHQV